jgi:hypothetical protein
MARSCEWLVRCAAGPVSSCNAFADCGLAFTPLFATPLADRFRLVAPDFGGVDDRR